MDEVTLKSPELSATLSSLKANRLPLIKGCPLRFSATFPNEDVKKFYIRVNDAGFYQCSVTNLEFDSTKVWVRTMDSETAVRKVCDTQKGLYSGNDNIIELRKGDYCICVKSKGKLSVTIESRRFKNPIATLKKIFCEEMLKYYVN
jgi:hypothetical protein